MKKMKVKTVFLGLLIVMMVIGFLFPSVGATPIHIGDTHVKHHVNVTVENSNVRIDNSDNSQVIVSTVDGKTTITIQPKQSKQPKK